MLRSRGLTVCVRNEACQHGRDSGRVDSITGTITQGMTVSVWKRKWTRVLGSGARCSGTKRGSIQQFYIFLLGFVCGVNGGNLDSLAYWCCKERNPADAVVECRGAVLVDVFEERNVWLLECAGWLSLWKRVGCGGRYKEGCGGGGRRKAEDEEVEGG